MRTSADIVAEALYYTTMTPDQARCDLKWHLSEIARLNVTPRSDADAALFIENRRLAAKCEALIAGAP